MPEWPEPSAMEQLGHDRPMSSNLRQVWEAEYQDGLRRLAGSQLSGIVPIRQELVDVLLRRWRPPSMVDSLRVRLLARNQVQVTASARVFGFRKHVEATLKLPPAIDFRERPIMQLQFVERSALAFVASLAAPLFGGLPPGITVTDSAVTVDLQQLLAPHRTAEWLEHVNAVAFDTEEGVVWLNVAMEIRADKGSDHTSAPPEAGLASTAWMSWFAGTRLALELRAHQSLVTETLAAALADATLRAQRPASSDGAALTQFLTPPRIRFEPEIMVLETEFRLDHAPA